MLAGLPITERVLDVDGIATTVLEAGDGPPLLLLHGGIECGGAYWAPVISRLAETTASSSPTSPVSGSPHPSTGSTTTRSLLVHRRPRADAAPSGRARRPLAARQCRRALRRPARRPPRCLVVYGAPGVGPYRMPMRLRYVAIRFGIRPTARNAERFDRFALLDLDATRRRDPEWFAAFAAYTRSRATVHHVKQTMRRLIRGRDEADPRRRPPLDRRADHALVGPPRPHGPARARARPRGAPRLAAPPGRRRRPRTAHRAARRVRQRRCRTIVNASSERRA